jgi:hypothetical protein
MENKTGGQNGKGASSTPTSSKSNGTSAATPSDDVKNRGWPKGKKRYPKAPGAPKLPLSGYVQYLNGRRDDVKKEQPDISFTEIRGVQVS